MIRLSDTWGWGTTDYTAGEGTRRCTTLGLPSVLVLGQEKEPRPSVPRMAMARSRLVLQKRGGKRMRQASGGSGLASSPTITFTGKRPAGAETGLERERTFLGYRVGEAAGTGVQVYTVGQQGSMAAAALRGSQRSAPWWGGEQAPFHW